MVQSTCSIDGCESRSMVRGLCQLHYGRAYRAGELTPLSRASQHRLSQVDTDARIAVCSICGPTRIRVRSNRRSQQCWTVRKKEIQDWRKRNPGRQSATTRSATPEQRREWWLRKKYGITSDEYEAMLVTQGGSCAVCGNPPSGRRLAVDHDHVTGEIRGLLCMSCNTALGHLRDDRAIISAAESYLDRT